MAIGALSGLRILDLSRLLPGPYCTMMLADLGAEVIKVEEPGKGDYLRDFPPKLKQESAFFLSVNRNKKSITLNLKSDRGREIFLGLVKKADVVLEGFRPGVMDKLGLGYDVLREINPQIIFCSISGYGQDGPFVKKAGHDINYLSIAGITGFTGTRDGRPVLPGIQIADIGGGGMLAAYSILAAVIARQKIGKGQYIDVSMMDGAMSWLSMAAGKYFADGASPEPANEMLNGRFACYNVYKTKDGRYMTLGALEPQFWSAFCEAVGRPDFIRDHYAEGERADEIIAEVAGIFMQRTRDEWVEFLADVDCCCAPVNTFDEAFSHPQVKHRQMVVEMEHPVEGPIRMLNFPGKFSETPSAIELPPPALGEHTEEIFGELGITKEEIAELAKDKIV
ncbi:MAG: CoA transferase [Syntrophobacterales bacterium]|nr:CoA transferase [Syntrophobacterales bacterium]